MEELLPEYAEALEAVLWGSVCDTRYFWDLFLYFSVEDDREDI